MSKRAWAVVALFAVLLVAVGAWSMTRPAKAPGVGASSVPVAAVPPNGSGIPLGGRGLVDGVRPIRPKGGVIDGDLTRVSPAQMLKERALSDRVRGRVGAAGFAVDETGLRAALDSRQREVGDCWRAAHTHEPSLAAARTLQIEVAPGDDGGSGTISWINSGATMLDSCLENALSGVKFAASEPATLRYPITFQ